MKKILVLIVVLGAGFAKADGISMLYLTCNNHLRPSISHKVDIISGFFEVNGQKVWTRGANVYSVTHFSNKESLIKSVAVTYDRLSHIEGEGFLLDQAGPGDESSFPAVMVVDLPGNRLNAAVFCEVPRH